MKTDFSYLDENKFLLNLENLLSKQHHLHQSDVERLARISTDQKIVNNSQLVSRSYTMAKMILQKWGYVFNVHGEYTLID